MNKKKIDSMGQSGFSVRNGVFLTLVYKGRQIVVHAATFTFKETIWVDDDLVFSGRGLMLRSVRTIDVGGEELELTYGMRRFCTQYFLEARRGGELIAQRVNDPFGKASGFGGWWLVLGGFAVGFSGSYFADFIARMIFGAQ